MSGVYNPADREKQEETETSTETTDTATEQSGEIQTEEDLERAIAEEEASSQDPSEEEQDDAPEQSAEEGDSEDTPEQDSGDTSETPADPQTTPTDDPEHPTEDDVAEEGEEDESAEEDSLVDASGFNIQLNIAKGRLDDYVKFMAPNQMVSDNDIANQQASLYRAFKAVLGQDGKFFTDGMKMITTYFKEYARGAFSPKLVARGFDVMALPSRDRLAFERLIRLFNLTAQSGQPSQVTKHYDLNKLLEVLPANTHEKLLEYYSAE